MGKPISIVFSDVYVCKVEEDMVIPANPIFYNRYVNGMYVRTKKHESMNL